MKKERKVPIPPRPTPWADLNDGPPSKVPVAESVAAPAKLPEKQVSIHTGARDVYICLVELEPLLIRLATATQSDSRVGDLGSIIKVLRKHTPLSKSDVQEFVDKRQRKFGGFPPQILNSSVKKNRAHDGSKPKPAKTQNTTAKVKTDPAELVIRAKFGTNYATDAIYKEEIQLYRASKKAQKKAAKTGIPA
jgi:hypothetical protein